MQTSLQFEEFATEPNLPTCSSKAATPIPTDQVSDQESLAQAERALLKLADYIYAQTSLKPISKTLFLISRCLLVTRKGAACATPSQLVESYSRLRGSLGGHAPADDFDFDMVVDECKSHISPVIDSIREIASLTSNSDALGLSFNTLLRGKFESGEGFGTFLTPEEVVSPMVQMLFGSVAPETLTELMSAKSPPLFGDICGGTGRFVFALYRMLKDMGLGPRRAEQTAKLFDQSSLAVGFGKLNFLFDDMYPQFECVGDSLVAPTVSQLRDRFALLATNPPFGIGKYRWRPELSSALSPQLARLLGLRRHTDVGDPSELFLYRNLDLLTHGGALAIVLPDGVIQSRRFVDALKSYEDLREIHISVAALVSLPVTTFALGGTVAKTSFMILRKGRHASDLPLYVAIAKHVGFLKRGNRRAPDPYGNDLASIAKDFLSGTTSAGVRIPTWRSLSRLVPTAICHTSGAHSTKRKQVRLGRLVDSVRNFASISKVPSERHFHISVLDIDETGLLDIIATSRNTPVTRALCCAPGDILVSCINPRIWRSAYVPNLKGAWTCSPEFLVLRPKEPKRVWELYFALHRGSVVRTIQSLAGGTSSSRQRVEKDQVLNIEIPHRFLSMKTAGRHARERVKYYEMRLREAKAYAALRGDGLDLDLGF